MIPTRRPIAPLRTQSRDTTLRHDTIEMASEVKEGVREVKEGVSARRLRELKRQVIRGALKSKGNNKGCDKPVLSDVHYPSNLDEFKLLFEINDVDISTLDRRPMFIANGDCVSLSYQTLGEKFEKGINCSMIINIQFCKTEDDILYCFSNGIPRTAKRIKKMTFWPIIKTSLLGEVPSPIPP